MKKILEKLKTRKFYSLPLLFSLLAILFYFLPFLYSIDSKTKGPIFINGYILFRFLEDSSTKIHSGSLFFLIALIFLGMLLLSSICGILVKKEYLKSIRAITYSLVCLVCGFSIAGIINLSQLRTMNLYLEFGSYLVTILNGFLFLGETFLLIQSVREKTAA